jgi:hypothetical protein
VTLDLNKLSRQMRQMSSTMAQQTNHVGERIAKVVACYQGEATRQQHWCKAVDLSRETANWLLASPAEPLDTVRDAPPRPAEYAIVATDGSQIDVDRHGMVACYLINIGHVYLRYGPHATARLSSQPQLYYSDDDLYLQNETRRIPIEGTYLGSRRDIQELEAAAAMSDELLTEDLPAIVLQDGTLMRWILSGAEKLVQERLLSPYLDELERMRRRGIPLASYISRSRGTELLGTIRLMFCPDVRVEQGRGANCNRCSDVQAKRKPSCHLCDGLMDADILFKHLAEGQRGPLFKSMSRINVQFYGEHLVHFFYMRVGREVGRVEIPAWVASDSAAVDQVHSLVYDQCVKGQGYPVALARAHEQAVVRGADRITFQRVLQSTLLQAELATAASLKQENKEYTRL